MIRLPIPRQRLGPRVELDRSERHYLLDVLRLEPGAALEVFDGEGGLHAARLAADGSLELGPRQQVAARRPIVLAQALAKGEKMELVVQKATELGATAIAPFSSERAVVKLEGTKASERVERWERIAQAAARQCQRADVPPVWPIASFAALLERARGEGLTALVLYEQERSARLGQAAAQLAGPLLVAVGPEGGFSDSEAALARQMGAQLVGLGPLILRTETAGLAALSVLQFLGGDLG